MPATIHHITPAYPTQVAVPTGWAQEMVTWREQRIKYFTNRNINTVGYWLLLKALTKSNQLKNWRSQKEYILGWLQCGEKTFYHYLSEMIRLQLVEKVDDQHNIFLVSYEKAAGALDIVWCGTYSLPYNPSQQHGKKVFQYILRGEEIRLSQQRQLDGLTYHLEKNPSLKSDLHYLMVKAGADGQRLLKNPRYYQERLLLLQTATFKEGSELLAYVFTHRADINRGVQSIAKAHTYKAKQSVSYLKRRLLELELVDLKKVCVRSRQRSRLYVPDDKGGKRDGYKWIGARRETALFLTDQISVKYEPISKTSAPGMQRKTA